MHRREFSLGLAAALTAAMAAPAWARQPAVAHAPWQARLRELEARLGGGRLGASMLDTATGLTLGWRAHERFPMTSSFKLLLAGWVLAQVDAGREGLDRRVVYESSALVPYSPMTERHVGEPGTTVGALCEATVTLSDNTAANLLLARHGGPAGLTRYLRQLGDTVTRLDRIEPELNEALAGDERDTTSPAAMLRSMQTLVFGGALSTASRAQLKAWLIGNQTGDKRLRAGVPGWLVGDKTGSGNHGSSNDVGIFWPPQGRAPVLVTCYMTQTEAPAQVRDAVIADVARQVAASIQRA